MTTKTDELKPCPFCGCANIHITPDEVGSGGQWVGPVHVVCGGDCVAGQSGDDRESAIAAWNRRAALQSQPTPPEISRYLLGKIVDEVFDGAIEDASVIEDIYRVIARETDQQSQGREDAERLDWLDKTAHCADWMEGEPTKRVIRAHDGAEFTGDTWREAIDHARRIEGDGDV